MKSCNFSYYDPNTVSEVVSLMSRHENAKLLAGGQSLVPMLNFRILSPEHIIDLNKVSDLFGIKENENHLSIGSMTRQSELLNSPIIIQSSPLISRALGYVGHDQTRNRGTIGGSLCHLDPAAELCIVASAYNAELTVTGKKGDRVIAMSDWPVDFLTPALNDDEILTNIRITPWQGSHGFCFIEFARREGDFAIVAVAVLIEITDHVISKASIALGGVAAGPVRLHEVETLLTGQSPGQELFKEAGLLAKKVDAMSDINFSTDYRKRLSGAFTERALHGAMAQFKGEGQGHG
jgi:carbon-monoxide dehydrogenase medium subunit